MYGWWHNETWQPDNDLCLSGSNKAASHYDDNGGAFWPNSTQRLSLEPISTARKQSSFLKREEEMKNNHLTEIMYALQQNRLIQAAAQLQVWKHKYVGFSHLVETLFMFSLALIYTNAHISPSTLESSVMITHWGSKNRAFQDWCQII